MFRLSSFFNIHGFYKSIPVGLDIGSQFTKFIFQNRVIKEPTVLLYSESSQEVLTVGKIAEKQSVAVPKKIHAFRPIQEGKIKNVSFLAQYLELSVAQISKRKQVANFVFPIPQLVELAIPLSQTSVQRNAYKKAISDAHFYTNGQFIPSSEGAFRTAQKENIVGVNACLIDFGAELTQMSIFVGGEIRYKAVIPGGGKELTVKIQDIVRERFHCDIDWHTAEKIKLEIGTTRLVKKDTLPHLVVRGRNILTNTPDSITLQSADFSEELLLLVKDWIEEVQVFFGNVPGTTLSEILEQGIVLYGGASQLRGLADTMQEFLKCSVVILSRPSTAVVEGLFHVKT